MSRIETLVQFGRPAPIYIGAAGKDRCMMGHTGGAWQHLSTPVKVRAPKAAQGTCYGPNLFGKPMTDICGFAPD